jgi:5-formyltetrahydrofolate cyclo-ligase
MTTFTECVVDQQIVKEKSSLREEIKGMKPQSSSVDLSLFFNFYPQLINSYVGLYKPMSDEMTFKDLSFLSHKAWPQIQGAHLKSPNESFKDAAMTFVESESFNMSTLGFLEPEASKSREIEKKNVEGARLGRGQGYYDRYLSGYTGLKVGVCHYTKFLNRPIPMDSGHDIYMDLILTDKHLYKVKSA